MKINRIICAFSACVVVSFFIVSFGCGGGLYTGTAAYTLTGGASGTGTSSSTGTPTGTGTSTATGTATGTGVSHTITIQCIASGYSYGDQMFSGDPLKGGSADNVMWGYAEFDISAIPKNARAVAGTMHYSASDGSGRRVQLRATTQNVCPNAYIWADVWMTTTTYSDYRWDLSSVLDYLTNVFAASSHPKITVLFVPC